MQDMVDDNSSYRGYVLAALLGAVAGGLFVALVTKAVPRMMSQIMSTMMQNMMANMEKRGIDPAEMCQRMMSEFKQES